MEGSENNKSALKGSYLGRKWFIKVPYKTTETHMYFSETGVELHQGSGFASAKYFNKTVIPFSDISHVDVKRKCSTINVILAATAVILSFALEKYVGLLAAAVCAFVGSTAVATIHYKNGTDYQIPTEWKSEAEDAKTKIDTALMKNVAKNSGGM